MEVYTLYAELFLIGERYEWVVSLGEGEAGARMSILTQHLATPTLSEYRASESCRLVLRDGAQPLSFLMYATRGLPMLRAAGFAIEGSPILESNDNTKRFIGVATYTP